VVIFLGRFWVQNLKRFEKNALLCFLITTKILMLVTQVNMITLISKELDSVLKYHILDHHKHHIHLSTLHQHRINTKILHQIIFFIACL
jgi:uncharacterized protein YqgQ